MNKRRRNWTWAGIAVLIVLAVNGAIFFSSRERVVDVPSTYSYGASGEFTSDSSISNLTLDNATAQYVALGEKPLLKLTNLHIEACPIASVLLFENEHAKYPVYLGLIRYHTGNSYMEIPMQTNISNYPLAVAWCNTTNTRLGTATLR